MSTPINLLNLGFYNIDLYHIFVFFFMIFPFVSFFVKKKINGKMKQMEKKEKRYHLFCYDMSSII